MMFLLNSGTVLLPFKELVDSMRHTLENIYPSVVREGQENARRTKPFLAKRHAKPNHVLHSLARSMLDCSTPEQLLKLQDEIDMIKAWDKKKNQDYEIDIQKLAEKLVSGRVTYETLAADGTVVLEASTNTDETENDMESYNAPRGSTFGRRTERQISNRPPLLDAVGYTSNTRPRPPDLELNPLSNWNTLDTSYQPQPDSNSFTSSDNPPSEEAFDYLFEAPRTEGINEEQDHGTKRGTVSLDWPSRSSGLENGDKLVKEDYVADERDDREIDNDRGLTVSGVTPIDSFEDLENAPHTVNDDTASPQASTKSKHREE
jgi:hypothetical protein